MKLFRAVRLTKATVHKTQSQLTFNNLSSLSLPRRGIPSCAGAFWPVGFGPVHLVHEAPMGRNSMAEGYCVKCKAKKEIAEAVEETMKNGRKAIKGKCPTCGTVMFKILGGKATPPTPPAGPPA